MNPRLIRPRLASAVVAVGLLALLVAAVPVAAQSQPPEHARDGRGGPPAHAQDRVGHYEVWALDQGTDLIHVYASRPSYREVATIDVSPDALADRGFRHVPAGDKTVPHMVEFDSRGDYAFIAATAGAATIVIDARAKEVVEVLGTGAGSHMAAVLPDDSAVWVAAIGTEELVEVTVERRGQRPASFDIGTRLEVSELLAPVEADHPEWRRVDGTSDGVDTDPEAPFSYASYSPVCHQYSPDGTEAWVTLGPGWAGGGLFVLDLTRNTVSAAWEPHEVRANCGVWITEGVAVANWSGEVIGPGQDTAGEWYVFDRPTKQLLGTHGADAVGAVEGLDAHGLRLTPDGSAYWMVNRNSDDGFVVDAATVTDDEPQVLLELTGEHLTAPDILDFSPDSRRVYVSQRGPHPVSGAPHAATGTEPGIAVLDAETGERVALLAPPEVTGPVDGQVEDGQLNDLHGVGVRSVVPGERGHRGR